MSRTLSMLAAALLAAGAARAEVPAVAADIAPVHSLVARVMQGLGAPELIVPATASPHGYALRPSEAAALARAGVVFWVGPDLDPWFGEAVASLAPDAVAVELMDAPGTTELAARQDALFEPEAEDPAEVAGGHEHAHGPHDPHAWLDPRNAAAWLDAIAAALAAADPENAAAYAANAVAGKAELAALSGEIAVTLDPVRGRPFIVFHDAYQYFERGFDFPAAGAIALSDASQPGPARLRQIRDRIADEGVACVLAEPQHNPDLVATVIDGTATRSASLDDIGAGLQPGPNSLPGAAARDRPLPRRLPYTVRRRKGL